MTPPALAVIVTGVEAVTELVDTPNVALVAPCATDTVDGTVAAAGAVLCGVKRRTVDHAPAVPAELLDKRAVREPVEPVHA